MSLLRCPLSLLVFVLPLLFDSHAPAGAYEYFEHRYIGNDAFNRVKQQIFEDLGSSSVAMLGDLEQVLYDIKQPKRSGISRSEEDIVELLKIIPFSFGDFTALAGDQTETPQDLAVVIKSILKMNNEDNLERVIVTRRE